MANPRKRVWRVVVGIQNSRTEGSEIEAIDVSNLDCAWTIQKTNQPEPNTCSLKIFNLPEQYRKRLEELSLWDPIKIKGQKNKKAQAKGNSPAPNPAPQANTGTNSGCAQPTARPTKKTDANAPKPGRILTEIYAGYSDTGAGLIWRGELRQAISTRGDDGTWTTSINGEDGGRTAIGTRSRKSYKRGTTLYTVVKDCADALGLGDGNLKDVEAVLRKRTFRTATALDGQSVRELDGVLRRAGIRYSIQNGVLQFRIQGQGLTAPAFVLEADSGLVGTPAVNKNGRVEAQMLVNSQVAIGSLVEIRARAHTGTYRVAEIAYTCDTRGQSWYANLNLVRS